MPAEEARYAAVRELGGVEQIKEECRDIRRVLVSLIRLLLSTPGVRELAFENLALRQQSVVLTRHSPGIRLRKWSESEYHFGTT